MRTIAGVLSYAHRQGMVHCDIKSANIMLNKHGEAMLTDFGIARMTDAATATMIGAGTPAYMSPEQVRGQDPTPQSDIYSLGIVLYEMLTGGERPFTGETATITGSTSEKVRWEQLNASPTPPSDWNAEISPQLESVVLKCLQKNASQRYQSALELINALEFARGEREETERPQPTPAPVVDAPTPPPVSPPESKETTQQPAQKKWLPVAGIAIAAMLLLGVGWLLRGGMPAKPAVENTLINTPAKTKTVLPPTFTPTITFTTTPQPTNTPIATPTPRLSIGSTWERPADGTTMLYIPAGKFQMGSDNDSIVVHSTYSMSTENEGPIHQVYLNAYWIDETEVTNSMFAAFLNSEGNQIEDNQSWLDANDRDSFIKKIDNEWQVKNGYENHPVVEVTWYGAQAYCQWAGTRLPTEAEWEKAARGDLEQKKYPWGDEKPTCEPNLVNSAQINCDLSPKFFFGLGYYSTSVKSYSPNGYGLYDMSGNVFEWVMDFYDSQYYESSPNNNPQGPSTGSRRVLRGGSFAINLIPANRVSFRNKAVPFLSENDYGFRCAKTASTQQ